jgi:pSer/pThr/pTyr-binding forkhead associated (FHA) protein
VRQNLTGQPLKPSALFGVTESSRTKTQSLTPALPENKKITISVIGGPSNSLMVEIRKPRTSIGRAGGGADIQLNDPAVSNLHCALGVTQDAIRLCDLDSQHGTYLDGKPVEAVELEHLSEFRIGSSLLLLIVIPKVGTNAK